MGVVGNFEFETKIKSSCEVFYDIFGTKKEEFIKIVPHRVPSIKLLKGELGATGCVIEVNYLLDGVHMISRENIESVDKKKKMITYNLFEGDLMKLYKTLKITIECCDNLLKWKVDYEKMNEEIQPPFKLQAFLSQLIAEIDAYYLNLNTNYAT